jgi:ornithine carbamoyltransferase
MLAKTTSDKGLLEVEFLQIPDLKGKDVLTLNDLTASQIKHIIRGALYLKNKKSRGIKPLKGKVLGMIFNKPSTRTRVSFEVAMWQLGGYGIFLNTNDLQIKRGEPIKDTARVLSGYVDGIVIRTHDHKEVEELAHYAEVPVINGLTNLAHPCQILADLLTIYEVKGKLAGLKLAYVGDGNNVANSLLLGCSKMGINIWVSSPKGHEVDDEILSLAQKAALENESQVVVTNDAAEAVKGADVVYTDVWVSMGEEEEKKGILEVFKAYQVNSQLLKLAADDVVVMHCLPAHRGEEITDEVIEGKGSIVFQQAENRLHAQKALLAMVL